MSCKWVLELADGLDSLREEFKGKRRIKEDG